MRTSSGDLCKSLETSYTRTSEILPFQTAVKIYNECGCKYLPKEHSAHFFFYTVPRVFSMRTGEIHNSIQQSYCFVLKLVVLGYPTKGYPSQHIKKFFKQQ